MSKLSKKLKKLRKKATKALKSAAKVGGKALGTGMRVLAPVASAVLGPGLGTAVGGGLAVGGAALKGGDRKSKKKALARTLKHVAGATAVTAGLGIVSGAGIGANILQSAGAIFNPAAKAGEVGQGGSNGLDDAFLGGSVGGVQGSGGNGLSLTGLDSMLGGGGVPGGETPGSPGTDGTFEGTRTEDLGNTNPGESSNPDGSKSLLLPLGIGAGVLVVGAMILK